MNLPQFFVLLASLHGVATLLTLRCNNAGERVTTGKIMKYCMTPIYPTCSSLDCFHSWLPLSSNFYPDHSWLFEEKSLFLTTLVVTVLANTLIVRPVAAALGFLACPVLSSLIYLGGSCWKPVYASDANTYGIYVTILCLWLQLLVSMTFATYLYPP